MLAVIEVLAYALVIVFTATQVIIPIFRDTQLFPIFRERKVMGKLKSVNQDLEIEELNSFIEAQEAKLREMKEKKHDAK